MVQILPSVPFARNGGKGSRRGRRPPGCALPPAAVGLPADRIHLERSRNAYPRECVSVLRPTACARPWTISILVSRWPKAQGRNSPESVVPDLIRHPSSPFAHGEKNKSDPRIKSGVRMTKISHGWRSQERCFISMLANPYMKRSIHNFFAF
jgi:hypothetical protein